MIGITFGTAAFLGCRKGPLPFPPLPISTPTNIPTYVSTPGCGFTRVAVPTPVIPPVSTAYTFLSVGDPVPGNNYVVRNLAQWQSYYGSSSAPTPPVDFSSQMLLINVQAYTLPPPSFGTSVQQVCWTSNEITVSCLLMRGNVPIHILQTPVPSPTPTPVVTEYFVTALAVPISSLPVTWVYTEELDAL
jgi:hypothetical protein